MPWSEQSRADLLKHIDSLETRKFDSAIDEATYANVNVALSEAFRAYAQGLPIDHASRCPICGTVMKLPIDPYGFDGPWWWSWCPTELPAPEACTHLQLLQGAVDLHGRKPNEARDSIRPGPAVPFVIGRILALDGMAAVISSRRLPAGDTVFVIAYYSANPVPHPDLYQPWRKQSMAVHNDQGKTIGWSMVDDPWDFDLRKWAATGKLWWITPADTSLTLQQSSPSPYEGLEGTRDMQIIEGGELIEVSGPTGQGVYPFE